MIASEDWQGTRPDYKVTSDEASFRVDYTPKVEMFVVDQRKAKINLKGHSVYLNTEHYFVSFGHFLAKNGQKVMS